MSGGLSTKGLPATRRRGAPAPVGWLRWLGASAAAGVAAGIVWWLAAPGGAFYGQGRDYTIWLARDLVLAGLVVLAGLAAAVLLIRSARRGSGGTARLLAVLAGGVVGSVLAWRTGVFAGDLFHTPPDNMPSPSIVFSLRSPSVLLLWPLATSAAVFLYTLVAHAFGPGSGTSR